MPKKPPKTKEEKSAEGFFPVEEDDLELATEKIVKAPQPKEEILKKAIEIPEKPPIDTEELTKTAVEKPYHKPDKKSLETIEGIAGQEVIKTKSRTKRKSKKTSKKTITKIKKYSPPKISLKKEGYELIITEKPQAANKIANALGNAIQKNINKVPYYEVDRQGQQIIVACAVGHLFTLKQNTPGYSIPIFDISWIPNYLARKKDFTKRYYDTILKLAKNAGSLTVATDFDIEGEVIGLNVVRFLCNQKDASRMKFSTLTKDELNKAYENKQPTLEWGQAIAGETRHYLDWFYGINLSRALMNAIKTTGKFRIMSTGRVQGPALKLIVNKEREIQAFKPKTYWQAFITISNNKNKLELKHTKDIFKKPELKKFENLKGKKAIAETKKRQEKLPPNPPFNLTILQTEAYKFYGITPARTLQIAQSLYLSGVISYPRTSSQKLPAEIGYNKILNQLAKKLKVEHLIKKQKPIEGAKTDPAHPSIYPTGDSHILSGQDEKIYNLIVARFLSLFCEDAIIDKKTVKATVDNLTFSIRGESIQKKAWLEIYPSKLKETQIPDMEGECTITDSRTEEKQTQPPKRYSPASILSELDKQNLGTKATRANILETLYDRGYVKDTSIKATPLGISLIATMEKYSPIIIDEALTRHFEKEMENIREITNQKEDIEKEQKVIEEAKQAITKIAKDFEKSEKKIGKELLQATIKFREQQKEENKLVQCPKCKKGDLAITYSKKTRKHFIACNAYPNCKTTYSLPPKGTIKKTGKVCEKCGFPLMMSVMPRKKPWFFCFNTDCPTNKERIEKYKEKIAEEENN